MNPRLDVRGRGISSVAKGTVDFSKLYFSIMNALWFCWSFEKHMCKRQGACRPQDSRESVGGCLEISTKAVYQSRVVFSRTLRV